MPRLTASLRLAILLVVFSSSLVFANGGSIATIAGAGQSGSMATGIPATTAQLTTPAGICADASNNLFIADSGNNRVVRVDAVTGLLTLVAGNGTGSSSGDGGPAAAASINTPMGVALDGAGNLFISEFQGNRIRRVDGQTGVITTIAGTGDSGFSGDGGPATSSVLSHAAGIAFDSIGNLYVADMGNNRVRRIDVQTGIITTVAGNGSSVSTADGVLASDAGMARPIWVAVDRSGGLLISEMAAARIRRVDPSSGILTTVAGNGNLNFTGDGVPAPNAAIGGTLALAVAPNGNLFFADGTGRIRRVDAATGWITTVAGNGTGPHGMSSAAAGGSGGGSSVPPCYSTVAGDNGPATSATLDGPFGLLLTGDGNLLISDSLACRVRRVDLPSPFSYTNTTLTTNATTLQPGQTVMLTATVSAIGLGGVPTGAIQFVDVSLGNVTVLGTVALNGGTASFFTTTGNSGGRLVMAIYSGDASFNGSGSPQITLSQSPASKYTATVTLSANQTPSPIGTTTFFTAAVTPPAGAGTAPSGPIVLLDGQTLVATGNVVNGAATLSTIFTAPGNHAMTAIYLGDNNYSQVAAATLQQPVNGTTQVSITSSAPNSTYGQPIQITISVFPSSATGSIQLIVDQVPIPGSGQLTNGTVVAQPNPPLAAGSHTITAVYSGDANNPPATSPTFTQNVAKATPSFTVTSSQNPSVAGQAVSLIVTMTPVSTGAALGLDIGNPPAGLQATWSAGRTSITTADLSPGTHTVTGTWAGDANVLAGSSTVLIQTVQAIATTTSLAASPNPSTYGGTVTLTATVLPAGTTGQVVFSDNSVAVGTANLAGGQAQVSIATLPVGSHSLTAAYAGDATHGGSNSAVVPQIVTAATVPSSVTLTTSANPSIAGRPLWFTATVSPATATGTVQFLDGASPLGSATIAGGWATLSLSTLPVGTHSITSLYSGDVNNLASTSAAVAEVIAPASPVVVVPGVITTLVGLPSGCAPGVTDCDIAHPVADAAGNIYFQQGYQILTRSAGGVVNTIAGNGQPGHSGDGGPALSASIGAAGQLAVHGSRVCFGEPAAYKVRCVDLSTGLIQGYGTGLQGSGGNGGNVSNASFNFPSGAAFDDAGNLYISDFGANNVRRIDAVTSIVTLFAGPGPGYSGAPLGDGGPAAGANLLQPRNLSYYNGGVYIADSGNGRIRRVDLVTGMISSAAASSSDSIVLDQLGNLFFRTGLTVEMMDPSGNVSAIADTNSYSGSGNDDILATQTVFGGMSGLGWDPVANRLMIADQSRLRQIFFTPPTTTTLTLSPNPVAPGGQVTLQATVSPATATGSVRFYQDGTLLGSVPLVNGVASITWTAPIGGNSTAGMRAVYGGDSNDNLSISATLTETAQQGTTTSTGSFTTSPNPSVLGGPVNLSMTVSPATATGAVAFYANSIIVGTATLVNGQAQLSLATLPAGLNLLMARYGGDSTYAGTTSNAVAQPVATAPTVVALTSSANPAAGGQSLSLTASISPAAATGTVQFLDGATPLGTATISGGSATLSLSTLSVGTHSITAVYNGDANIPAGTSSALTQTIAKAVTTVVLTALPNPAVEGQSVTLTAVVTPGTATGMVQIFEGTGILGSLMLSGGSASLTLSPQDYAFSVGTHSITVNYNGDANYAMSTSAALTLTIVKRTASSMTLTSSPNPSAAGQAVIFTAKLSPAAATGSVLFVDGTTVIGTAAITGGSASFTTANLTSDTHGITAVYNGDVNYAASSSLNITQTVNKLATSVVLTASPNPAMEGQAVTLTAMVTPSAATGMVQIFEGTGILGSVVLSGGSASLTLSPQVYAFSVGTHSITVNYNGDANYSMSTSAVLNLTIVKRTPTSMTLTSSPNPSAASQAVTFTAKLSPAAATGSVLFVDGTTVIGTAPISSGTASFTASALTAGSHGITAVYNGDVNYAASSSLTITQTVKVLSATSLTSNNATVVSGQTVQFTASVSPAAATGSIQFRDGSSALGTVTLSNGSAVLAISSLVVGVHSITATYSGDANDSGSTSPILTETVNAPPPGPPAALSATAASSSQINLNWTASPTSGVTYNVYASVTAGFAPSAANRIATGVTTTSYSHTGLSASTAYYYLVTAWNAKGESAASNQTTATTKAALSCHVVYTVTAQWNVGFGTAIAIKNTGTTPISAWNLTWTWAGNQKITQSWNSEYTQTGANATLTNESWNPTTAAGATLSGVGFNGSYSGTNSAPTAFYVNGTLCH